MKKGFEIKSVKVDEFLGVRCKYLLADESEGGETLCEYSVDIPRAPHPELFTLFDIDASLIVADIMRDGGVSDNQTGGVHVDSLTISGKGENRKVAFSGFVATNYGKMKIKSPRINFPATSDGIVKRADALVLVATIELHKYLFENVASDDCPVFGE